MDQRSSPEFVVLKECIRWYVSGGTLPAHTAFAFGEMDWEYLQTLASRHRIASVLYLFLSKNHAAGIPETFLAALKAKHFAAAFLSQAKARLLLKLTAMFQEEELLVVPWRGFAMAQAYYDAPSDRNFGDLDFLIKKEDLPRIKALLFREGYHLGDVGATAETIEKEHHAMAFVKEEAGIPVELDCHWAFSEKKWRIAFPDAGLWERLQTLVFSGRKLQVMHPEDLLLALTIHHGLRNRWNKWKYLLDLALMIRKETSCDWNDLLSKAKRLGIEPILIAGILAAHGLAGTSIPSEVSNRAARSFRAQWLSSSIQHQFETGKVPWASWLPVLFRFLPMWRHAFGEQWKRLFLPNINDFEKIHFPARLRLLYYPYRQLRLFHKYFLQAAWNYLQK